MERALYLLAILLSTIMPAVHAAEDDPIDEEPLKLEDCAVVPGRKLQVGVGEDGVVSLFEKGKELAQARLPDDFNDAKSSVSCQPGVVAVWSQAGFSCSSTTYAFAFAKGKLELQKKHSEDPCRVALERAVKALDKGDAVAASKEAESVLYPDHYIDPGFEERMLEIGRKQAKQVYQIGDKPRAARIAEAVIGWAQNAFQRCVGKDGCSMRKGDAIAAYNDLGFFIDEGGQHAEAEAMLKEVVAADPQRAAAWLNLADAAWAQGKQQAAKEAYRKYRNLIPEPQWPSRVRERG